MTVTDLLALATDALKRRDEPRFRDLEDEVRGWLASEQERDTLLALLDSMAEAAELLCEEEL